MFNIMPILFRFINTGIIIGLGYYFYKTRIRSKIDEKITQKEMLLKGLEEQGYFLEGKSQELELQLEKQGQQVKRLEQKIDDWRTQILIEKQKQQQENQRNQTRIADHIALKNKYLYEKTVQKKIMPTVIHEVEQSLQTAFNNAQTTDTYTQSIVDHLGQGKV